MIGAGGRGRTTEPPASSPDSSCWSSISIRASGTEADQRLSVHMVEHMVMWLVVAPLLAAGAPVRLAFYALARSGRRTLGRCLRSRPVSVVTGPVGSVSLFSTVLLVAHLPAVYGLALSNDYVHEIEHGLFLITSLLVWAPIIGVDPLPHRPAPRGQMACMLACMVPMAVVAAWLSDRSESGVRSLPRGARRVGAARSARGRDDHVDRRLARVRGAGVDARAGPAAGCRGAASLGRRAGVGHDRKRVNRDAGEREADAIIAKQTIPVEFVPRVA